MLEYLKTYRDIISIYKRLLTESKNMGSSEVYELYREFLKLSIKLSTNNPTFYEDFNKYRNCNCYLYALCLTAPSLFAKTYEDKEIEQMYHNVGFMTNEMNYSTDLERNLSDLERDFEILGIDSYECDRYENPTHGGYKIAIFKAPHDIHFVRQNRNGTWSHKMGYTDTIERVDMSNHEVFEFYKYVKTLEIVKPR